MYRKLLSQLRVIRLLTALVFVTLSTLAIARNPETFADSIMALPKDQQIEALWSTFFPASLDSVVTKTWFTELQRSFRQRKADQLERQAWMMLVYYDSV